MASRERIWPKVIMSDTSGLAIWVVATSWKQLPEIAWMEETVSRGAGTDLKCCRETEGPLWAQSISLWQCYAKAWHWYKSLLRVHLRQAPYSALHKDYMKDMLPLVHNLNPVTVPLILPPWSRAHLSIFGLDWQTLSRDYSGFVSLQSRAQWALNPPRKPNKQAPAFAIGYVTALIDFLFRASLWQ